MEKRRPGKTGHESSVLAFGGALEAGEQEQAVAQVKQYYPLFPRA